MRLNLDLPPQLVLNLCVLQLGLEQHLQSHNKPTAFLTGKIDIAKLAYGGEWDSENTTLHE